MESGGDSQKPVSAPQMDGEVKTVVPSVDKPHFNPFASRDEIVYQTDRYLRLLRKTGADNIADKIEFDLDPNASPTDPLNSKPRLETLISVSRLLNLDPRPDSPPLSPEEASVEAGKILSRLREIRTPSHEILKWIDNASRNNPSLRPILLDALRGSL